MLHLRPARFVERHRGHQRETLLGGNVDGSTELVPELDGITPGVFRVGQRPRVLLDLLDLLGQGFFLADLLALPDYGHHDVAVGDALRGQQ